MSEEKQDVLEIIYNVPQVLEDHHFSIVKRRDSASKWYGFQSDDKAPRPIAWKNA